MSVKNKVKILQNFVAFWEYMNFNSMRLRFYGVFASILRICVFLYLVKVRVYCVFWKDFSPLYSKDATQELLNSYLVYYKSWSTMASKKIFFALAFTKGMIFNFRTTVDKKVFSVVKNLHVSWKVGDIYIIYICFFRKNFPPFCNHGVD